MELLLVTSLCSIPIFIIFVSTTAESSPSTLTAIPNVTSAPSPVSSSTAGVLQSAETEVSLPSPSTKSAITTLENVNISSNAEQENSNTTEVELPTTPTETRLHQSTSNAITYLLVILSVCTFGCVAFASWIKSSRWDSRGFGSRDFVNYSRIDSQEQGTLPLHEVYFSARQFGLRF